ncbi:MAG: fibronectin type III domain-containing protein [Verrucomicrobia bacterium]|nr:fibronectin type III domain-containing protein [Verrucomicrobiota bacterium]
MRPETRAGRRVPRGCDLKHAADVASRGDARSRARFGSLQVAVDERFAGVASAVREAMMEARHALNRQKTAWQLAMTARNGAVTEMRRLLRALLKELSVRLSPLDERWVSFGFNKPGAKVRPDAPTNVTVVRISETAESVQWEKAPGADYYRVHARVVGVDAEATVVGTPVDPDFMFESLALAETEVWITAMNSGGESRRSEVILVEIGAGAVEVKSGS